MAILKENSIEDIIREDYKYITRGRQEEVFQKVGRRLEEKSELSKIEKANNEKFSDRLSLTQEVLKKLGINRKPDAKDYLAIQEVKKNKPRPEIYMKSYDITAKAALSKIRDIIKFDPAKKYQLNYQERAAKSFQANVAAQNGLIQNLKNFDINSNWYITIKNGLIRPNDAKSFGIDGIVKIGNRVYFVENKVAENMTRQYDRSLITFAQSCKAIGVNPIIVFKEKLDQTKLEAKKTEVLKNSVKGISFESTAAVIMKENSNTKFFGTYEFTSWLKRNKCVMFSRSIESEDYNVISELKKYLGNKILVKS